MIKPDPATQAFKAAGRPYPQEAFSQGLVYRPVILAQAEVRFLNRKYNLDEILRKTAMVADPDRRGLVRWEEHSADPVDAAALESATDPQARFARLEAPFTEAKTIAALERDFEDWVFRNAQVSVRANEALDLYAGPQVSSAEFLTQCSKAAREGRDAEVRKVAATYDTKLKALKEKQSREQRELDADERRRPERQEEEENVEPPALAAEIQHHRTRGERVIHGRLPRQAVIQEVPRLQEHAGPRQEIGLMLLEPEELAGGVVGVRRNAGVMVEERLAKLLAEPGALRSAAAIHPDNAARERLSVAADGDDAFALGGQADGGNDADEDESLHVGSPVQRHVGLRALRQKFRRAPCGWRTTRIRYAPSLRLRMASVSISSNARPRY